MTGYQLSKTAVFKSSKQSFDIIGFSFNSINTIPCLHHGSHFPKVSAMISSAPELSMPRSLTGSNEWSRLTASRLGCPPQPGRLVFFEGFMLL